ncbi:MAG TPA: glutamate--cysteine ligase [Myxococcota bacterium]|nr:glutamate--cysteine ligase [Myxococcota bacterium]
MSLTREDPRLSRPAEDVGQLVEYFREGETARADWRVGTEHEKLGLYAKTLKPIPYDGEKGIHALLSAIETRHGWKPLTDAGRLVGLERDGRTITLEPGGQLELSGAPVASLHETEREFREHIAEVNEVSKELGLVWLGLGLHPLAPVSELPRMPRERHQIMREYLGARDTLGLHMMHATAGVQANFDFADEADAARKLRLALAASPVSTALFANSPFSEGKPNGFQSRRAEIWRHTDNDRWSLLPFAFAPDFGEGTAYRSYTEWALDVPMFLIVRDGHSLPARGLSFREFMAKGLGAHRATLADWVVHLTTVFPEVRMKRVIETRGADAVPGAQVVALPAFWKGLLYDDEALAAGLERLARWSHADVDALHATVAREGLRAKGPDAALVEVARELVQISRHGLQRQAVRNASGRDESLYLEPLDRIIERGTSPAAQLLEGWSGPWRRDFGRVIEQVKY